MFIPNSFKTAIQFEYLSSNLAKGNHLKTEESSLCIFSFQERISSSVLNWDKSRLAKFASGFYIHPETGKIWCRQNIIYSNFQTYPKLNSNFSFRLKVHIFERSKSSRWGQQSLSDGHFHYNWFVNLDEVGFDFILISSYFWGWILWVRLAEPCSVAISGRSGLGLSQRNK